MALTNYGELKTAMENILKDAVNLTNRIPEFIKLAEDDVNLDLRIRAMEQTADLTIASGDRNIGLPSRYVGMRRIYIAGGPNKPLELLAPMDFWAKYVSTETGPPKAYTIEGEEIILGPIPDTAYTGKILYWQAFATLLDDADTNWIFGNASGLYLYGGCRHAAPYIQEDERIPVWQAYYSGLKARVKDADELDRFSGAPIQSRPAVPAA